MITTYTNGIFCFTEAWLTKFEEENFCNPLLDDYVCLRNDRLASMSDNKKRAPLKKCYIRKNKNSFQLADKWLTRKTVTSTDKFPETNF